MKVRETPATLGVGGALHDFAVAVIVDERMPAVVIRAEEVVGLPHGVNVLEMQRIFDSISSSERAVGMWLARLSAAEVVGRTIEVALARAGVPHSLVQAIGYSCPEVLLPRWVWQDGRVTKHVNRLDAHAFGVLESCQGDSILVLGGVGDQGEVSALYGVSSTGPIRRWTVREPGSLGLLLDAAAMENGYSPLDRDYDQHLFRDDGALVPAGVYVGSKGYLLPGIRWTDMSNSERRSKTFLKLFDSAPDRSPRALAGLCAASVRDIIRRVVEHAGSKTWLAGEGALHSTVMASAAPEAKLAAMPGDDGAAIGAARMAIRQY